MEKPDWMVWGRGDPPWAPPDRWSLGKVFGVTVLLVPVMMMALWISTITRTGCTGSVDGDQPNVVAVESSETSGQIDETAGWCLDRAVAWWTPGLAFVGAALVAGWLPVWIVHSGIASSTSFAGRLGLVGLGAATGASGIVSLAWIILGSVDRSVPG
ncbi:MAG: hypothetical protein GY713_10995 [Actinomycetia bacterium]|nr:hypothetical protein [Actinomycetes bacterium]MCP3911469.1 hypothetical protein [Actinomycetes bacterium]